jgi:hypothetical protein
MQACMSKSNQNQNPHLAVVTSSATLLRWRPKALQSGRPMLNAQLHYLLECDLGQDTKPSLRHQLKE